MVTALESRESILSKLMGTAIAVARRTERTLMTFILLVLYRDLGDGLMKVCRMLVVAQDKVVRRQGVAMSKSTIN